MNIENFLTTLPMMLYGMSGIFLVILFIFFVIKLLNKVFK